MKKCNKRHRAELEAASTMEEVEEEEDDDHTPRMREKKKRRISSSDYELSTSSSLQTLLLRKTTENDKNSSSQSSAVNSVHNSLSSSSPCSSNDSNSNELVIHSLRSVDLKSEGMEIQQSKSRERDSRETTPVSDLCVPDEMDSTAEKSNRHILRSSAAAKMPSTAEIEEFFASAEKLEQKRFIDKYNYDIVKDVPLQGRFQWVRLKP
ncbi:Cyclin-dependent kinase inhibitor domain [Dillenia turbinata]|uniref:Cyclin-dependent kinase inhibitor n=1 Tax=Dillenia turbinata TaxID=194707 RepID=A0AAN8YVB8_9MAGN